MTRSAPDETDSATPLAQAVNEATRAEIDEGAYWAAVERLRSEGVSKAWKLVTPLVQDERPEVRSLVPDTLRYFELHSLREETVALLAQMLETEASPVVLVAIASAFVDLSHERAAELLPPLLTHVDASVRHAAVHGMLTVTGPSTVQYFLQASTDPDKNVRNWATFGLRLTLGEPGEADALDTEEVRSALAARLVDEEAEIRSEALLALATRRDDRVLEPLKHELRHWPEWDHCIEAAEHMGSAELFPLLTALLQQNAEEEPALRAAIEACKPAG